MKKLYGYSIDITETCDKIGHRITYSGAVMGENISDCYKCLSDYYDFDNEEEEFGFVRHLTSFEVYEFDDMYNFVCETKKEVESIRKDDD